MGQFFDRMVGRFPTWSTRTSSWSFFTGPTMFLHSDSKAGRRRRWKFDSRGVCWLLNFRCKWMGPSHTDAHRQPSKPPPLSRHESRIDRLDHTRGPGPTLQDHTETHTGTSLLDSRETPSSTRFDRFLWHLRRADIQDSPDTDQL